MKFLLQIDASNNVMTDALKDMLSKFFTMVPNVLGALVIFVVGYIVSKLLSKAIRRFLISLKVDQIGEKLNDIDIVRKTNVKISLSAIASKLIYYVLMLFFAIAATSILGIPEVSALVKDIFDFLPRLLVALIVLVVGILMADAIKTIVTTTLKSLGVPSAATIGNVVFYFLFINIAILALSQAGIDTAFLSQNISIIIAGVVGAFAIGYGLASKDTMSNFLASIYSKEVFNVGDRVSVDGVSGVVVEKTRSTLVIKTEAGKAIIPLHKVANSKIEIYD